MSEKRTSVFSSGLVWSGAGVSITEILTSTYLAPLGFEKSIAATLLGHVIDYVLLFLAGFIEGYARKSSMETIRMSFGERGSLLFYALNVLQPMGWTSIIIYNGALAAGSIFPTGKWIWYPVIGGLILVRILTGIQDLGKINILTMGALFILTLILCRVTFTGYGATEAASGETMSFGAAVELSVAMPLSQFPLISDYAREAKCPFVATATSAAVYGVVSIFMCVIGMGAVIYTGEYDISIIMVKTGLGLTGLLIVVLSAVTITLLDVYSAGMSSMSISQKIKEKWAAVAVMIIDTAAVMMFPMNDITNFLYLIGFMFTPMITIQIMDYFLIKQDHKRGSFYISNLVMWFVGFMIYRILMHVNTPVGSALPDMTATVGLYLVYYHVTASHETNTQNVTKV